MKRRGQRAPPCSAVEAAALGGILMSASNLLSPVSRAVEALWNARELAQRLGIHRSRLYHLVRTGRIPHLRVGRGVRFDPDAIREWEKAGGWSSPSLKRKAHHATESSANAERGQWGTP